MPNRYEREIEEILRNLEQTEPKQGSGQRFGTRARERQQPRPRAKQPRTFSWNISTSERLLLIAVIAALLGGGYAFTVGQNLFTALIAFVGLVCIILVALSDFLFRSRPSSSLRYGNVTVTPLRRNFFSNIKTRWNLFWLKLRYRRGRK